MCPSNFNNYWKWIGLVCLFFCLLFFLSVQIQALLILSGFDILFFFFFEIIQIKCELGE